MENIIDRSSLVKTGEMTDHPFTMSPEKSQKWKIRTAEQIRARLFSLGQPLIYSQTGQLMAEFADGSTVTV